MNLDESSVHGGAHSHTVDGQQSFQTPRQNHNAVARLGRRTGGWRGHDDPSAEGNHVTDRVETGTARRRGHHGASDHSSTGQRSGH